MRKFESSCILPWIHVASRADGIIRPCCISDFSKHYGAELEQQEQRPNLQTHSFSEIQNSEFLKSIRQKMIQGQQPDVCQVCFKTESRGVVSKRQQENKKWNIQHPKVSAKYLDLRFNTTCNLKCVMCSAKDSSFWESDTKKYLELTSNSQLVNYFSNSLLDKKETNYDFFFKNFNASINGIEEIYFAGGEPLLQPQHARCLEILDQSNRSQHVSLSYNTNGTLIDETIIKTWSRFKKVQVNLSLDGVAEKNSYIRYPSRWDRILKSIKFLDESPENIDVRVTTTVSALNIYDLGELMQWKSDQKFRKIQTLLAPGDIDLNIVYLPSHMSIQIFNEDQKQILAERLEQLAEAPFLSAQVKKRVTGLKKYMYELTPTCHNRLDTFVEYLRILDSERKLDSKKIFPFLNALGIIK